VEPRSNPDHPDVSPSRPTSQEAAFPIAGIGASAGGLKAFQELLENLPARPGLAVVLLPHLSPSSQSMLTTLLQKSSKIPLVDAKEAMRLEPDHIYVLPPNTTLALHQGVFRAISPRLPGTHPLGIDYFLFSLAAELRERAIGVVLSGSASDGAAGIRAIKGEGGITYAQGDSAEFPGMPQAAVATGCVDFILNPREIAEDLVRVARHPYLSAGAGAPPAERPSEDSPGELTKILHLLRERTGVEFILYKSPTVLRRIARRMAVRRIERLPDYHEFLQTSPEEIKALHDDILIKVTSFFRDPETFEVLKQRVFPKLLKERPANTPLRFWVPGCATGEEVYSLAIALLEYFEGVGTQVAAQIFGSDLSEGALATARAGLYDASIAADVSPMRLSRFCIPQKEGGFQIQKRVRDLCLFAKHDLTRDPPFSRLDLLSCRNVLIYLGPILQQRVVPYFHYALKPGGFLMLGTSESVDRFAYQFSPFDKKCKIYTKAHSGVPDHGYSFPLDRSHSRPAEGGPSVQQEQSPGFDLSREVNQILLRDCIPGGLVVDAEGRVLEIRGNTGSYFHPASGKPTFMLSKMLQTDLLPEVESAIREADQKGARIRRQSVQYRSLDRLQRASIEVRPLQGPTSKERYFIVLFHEMQAEVERADPLRKPAPSDVDQLQADNERLSQALDSHREYQQTIIEKIETSNEELRSSQEELLSSNEELQSTNEELETAKEELQSTNEELTTLNDELRQRNLDLAQANSDLSNVLSSVPFPIVIVDKSLRLRKTTPAAEKLLNILPTDVNRPITDLKPIVQTEGLERLLRQTFETGAPTEQDVQDKAGRWCSLRIRPYRSADDQIDGAVLAVVDIDEVKRDALANAKARDFSEAVIDSVPYALLVLDDQLRVLRVNTAFSSLFQVAREESEGHRLHEIGNRQWDIPGLRSLLENILPGNSKMVNFEMEHDFAKVGKKTLLLHAGKLTSWHTPAPVILLALEDVSHRKTAENEVLKLNQNLERRVKDRTNQLESAKAEMEAFTYSVAHDLRAPLRAMNQFSQVLVEDYSNRNLDASGQAILRRIIHSSAKMDLLIRDLLTYSRLSREDIEIQTLTLAPIIEESVQMLASEVQARQARVHLQGPFPSVRAHRVTLGQAIINVLSNALAYMPPGVRPDIQIRAEGVEKKIRLWIEDNGIGIDPKHHERIFRLFERLNHSEEYPGTGIGLAIVRKAMERMDGTVGLESALGKGARFYLELPRGEPS
jgi:two-component system CheB/CheR fusion protein